MNFKHMQDYFNWLYKLERFSMKYDLSNITALCKALGNPQNKFRSIHIAGTNGKGAAASFTASVLMEHGLKTGIFTSPHILNFNERIRINGSPIPNSYIKSFLNNNSGLIKKVKPSFFEVNTAMAFTYFAEKKVDAAVIECGLGGRLDSTNILNPDIIIITQIDLDHMQWLGNTLHKIAIEKLGIVKPGIKTIVSDSNNKLNKLFHNTISKDELIYLDDVCRIQNFINHGNSLEFTLKPAAGIPLNLSSPLPARYQARNIAAAYYAAKEFLIKHDIKFSVTSLKKGIKNIKSNTGYFGRLETINQNNRNYLLDVSHNPNGIMNAVNSIRQTGYKPDAVIFGIMNDKDHTGALKELTKYFRNIILTKPDYERAEEPGVLYTAGSKINNKAEFMLAQNVKDALVIAEKKGYKNIAVMGSFFMVSDALKALGFKKLPF